MSIVQIVSNLAKHVQMLVQENRARVTMLNGRIVDEEKVGVEARAPAMSHSHPYSDPKDSRRYQPVDLLKEREHRPARFTNVFDRLGDEPDSHQRKAKFHDGRMNNQGRQMGPWNQGYKIEVNEATPIRSKTTSKVSTSQPRSKFCRIHWSNNHDTDECPDVRTTVDKMVENIYRPTGISHMGSIHSHDRQAIPIIEDGAQE
ncbi:hypothetical protein Fot_38149 [Forsythia ovata]|uniref:Uncharacterized protein n=1 Tax=Forsythia ovata TaxID=205694 RepID=A0ABD1S3J5_9LAMI